MEPFDFFIAHAGPDIRRAEDLCWELQDQQYQVFLDQQGISPGAPWPTTLRMPCRPPAPLSC